MKELESNRKATKARFAASVATVGCLALLAQGCAVGPNYKRLATVGGLIALALTGGELWRPLTAVHIFGLLFATSLTLIALPVLYYIFCAKLRWIK